jgi:hypothetical protein
LRAGLPRQSLGHLSPRVARRTADDPGQCSSDHTRIATADVRCARSSRHCGGEQLRECGRLPESMAAACHYACATRLPITSARSICVAVAGPHARLPRQTHSHEEGSYMASWLFIRGSESIWIERPFGTTLIVAGPGSRREQRTFINEDQLQRFQMSMAERLAVDRWILWAYNQDRRDAIRQRRSLTLCDRSSGKHPSIDHRPTTPMITSLPIGKP